ncbi:hypothetical protein V9T40_004832 [Parthenolecanium corni]|uniref:Methylosome protein 50 n=1 Tax=Parthenolecanium corni TaxID=536013 RepID=A0AAN9TET0_9HEMI
MFEEVESSIIFMSIHRDKTDGGIIVAASNLINTAHWSGFLWYFPQEENIIDSEYVMNNNNSLKYPLPSSICDGALLMDSNVKFIVSDDTGWLSVYSLANHEEFNRDDDDDVVSGGLTLNNDISRVEHDHSILSVSVTGRNSSNQKAVTGGMDCCIIVWDIETFAPETIYESAHIHHVTSVRFIGCDNRGDTENSHHVFASTSLDGYCLLWDKRQQFPAKVMFRNETCGLTSLDWSSNLSNELIIGSENGYLTVVDFRRPKEPVYSACVLGRAINRISSYHHDMRNYVAISGNCRTLKVIRRDNDSFLDVYVSDKHNDYVRGLTWLEKKDELLACAWDSRITKHFPFSS